VVAVFVYIQWQAVYLMKWRVTGYWVVPYKASQALQSFCDLLCVPIWVLIPLIHPPVLSGCAIDI
jgi:hypothetical protein